MATPSPGETPEAGATGPGWLARERLVLAGLVALSFGLRALHVLGSRASPLFDAPQMDALYHVEWARAFAAGEPFHDGPYFRAPLYPWFLGVQMMLFGPGLLAPRLVQSLLGALGTWLVHRIGRRLFGPAVGLVAAALHATYWVLIFYDGELLLESLAVPLYLAGIERALAWDERPTGRGALAAGLLFGLSAITRPNVLLFLPLLGVWMARRRWREAGARAALASVALALAGVLAPILPITARNAAAGDAVLIASQAGVNFWIGNNPASDGTTAIVPGTREDWWGGYYDAIAQAEEAEGRELRPSEVSGHYLRRGLGFATSEPGAWLRLFLWKARLFWIDWELGNNEEVRFLAHRLSPWMRALPVGFGLLAPLAFLGLFARRRGAWRAFPLWGFLAVYSLSVVLFFVNARFRVPVLPGLAIYAAAALVWLGSLARQKRWRPLGVAALALAALVASSKAVPPTLRRNSESNGWLVLASGHVGRGEFDEALPLLERSLEAWPQNRIALRGLAICRTAQGDPVGAEAAWREALGLAPEDTEALLGLAALLTDLGRTREAIELAERARALQPASARAHLELGRALHGAGRLPDAAASFEEAARLDPRDFAAAYSLGATLQDLGRPTEALAALRRALASPEPDDETFLFQAYARAVNLAGARSRAEALELARAMRARFPDDPNVARVLADLERP